VQFVIVCIANAMIVESSLPDISWCFRFRNCMGEAALDALHAAFQGLVQSRSEDGMEVIGHDNERMQ
jgi:hypothetical protein